MTEATADSHAAPTVSDDQTQHHPLRVYFIVWFWLFVLSACSYWVDIAGFQGLLRWSLILFFMMAKAILIMAIFMHMRWERAALVLAVTVPVVAIMVFVGIMIFESDYVLLSRETYLTEEPFVPEPYGH